MKASVSPSILSGNLDANPSKSAMQRAVAAALLATGSSKIYNPSPSDDCVAALQVAERLGAKILYKEDHIEIRGKGIHPVEDTVNCGEAGLGIRMFTPLVALSDQKISIQAKGSLQNRPMDFFEQVLPQLGVYCKTLDGKPPLQVQGPLQARDIEIDGSLSSQFLTGLLMAYGAVGRDVTITVHQLTSRPYIQLTLDVMQHFGVEVLQQDMEKFYFGAKQAYQPREYRVEGDWSGAAFLLVAGALGGQVQVGGLKMDSAQSDIAIVEALKTAGAKVTLLSDGLRVEKGALEAFEFDATQCPDLFPPLVALAAQCKGITRIWGAERLTHKESNRSEALKEEFKKLGIAIEVEGDLMRIYGGSGIQGGRVHSHFDHRIAMACAVAAICAAAPIEIEEAQAVNKSYPEFWEHLKTLGGEVTLSNS